MLIYPFLLHMLRASEEDRQRISAICRYIRSESESFLNETHVDCPCCNGEEYKTVSYTTRTKDNIISYITPK